MQAKTATGLLSSISASVSSSTKRLINSTRYRLHTKAQICQFIIVYGPEQHLHLGGLNRTMAPWQKRRLWFRFYYWLHLPSWCVDLPDSEQPMQQPHQRISPPAGMRPSHDPKITGLTQSERNGLRNSSKTEKEGSKHVRLSQQRFVLNWNRWCALHTFSLLRCDPM